MRLCVPRSVAAWTNAHVWPRSLELLRTPEGEGLALCTNPLCLHPCGSEAVHLWGASHSSLEPIQSPNLLLKDRGKSFSGAYSNTFKPSNPGVHSVPRDGSWRFLRTQEGSCMNIHVSVVCDSEQLEAT